MKRILAILAILFLLLGGCTLLQRGEKNDAADFSLYFGALAESAMGKDALQAVSAHVEDGQALSDQALATTLVEQLLDGPATSGGHRLIPKGVTLLELELQGARAYVDLSAGYRSLSGIALTLADYSIALTLTQLPSIAVVSVTVQGQPLLYRSSQSFAPRDVLLTSDEDVVGTVDATLWFLDAESGQLVAEERTLELYEGDTQSAILLEALLGEPESKALISPLPEDFGILSAWLEEDICHINLPSVALTGLEQAQIYRALRALALSAASLESVSHVQFKVDGESRNEIAGISLDALQE